MHLAISGNIGSGKTTLTKKLSEHYKWIANYEDVENNPYLNDFYKDMQRWSFNLQVYFLNKLGKNRYLNTQMQSIFHHSMVQA